MIPCNSIVVVSQFLGEYFHPYPLTLCLKGQGKEYKIELGFGLNLDFVLQDQCDIIDKHTQSGLDLVEKYVKFVKERTEIEQNYAKQLR